MIVLGLLAPTLTMTSAKASTFKPIANGDIIASLQSGTVNEYSPSGTFIQTLVPNANLPAGSAFDGAGNLYVTEFSGNDILKVDARTGAVSVFSNDTILADGSRFDSPESIAFGPGYSLMYVSDANRFRPNGGIHVIDTATGKGVRFLPLPSSSGSEGIGESDWLAFNPSASLYMTNENATQGIMQVDLATGDIKPTSFAPNLPHTGYALSFDRQGNIWLSDTSTILEYNPTGGLLRTITNPNFNTVFSAVFNPPFNTVYAGDLSTGNIFTYDLIGNLKNTFNVGSGVSGLSVAGTIIVPNSGWQELNQGRTVASSSAYGNVSGRVTSLAVAADNPKLVFAGTAGGGVWRSADGGQSWTPLSDKEPTLTVGAIALDPRDDNTLYVGTGDNWLGFGSLPGEGIRYTHDALDPQPKWDWLRDPATNSVNFAGQRIMSMVIDSDAPRATAYPSNVLVASETGVWQSGDGGQSWSLRIGTLGGQRGTSFNHPSIGWVVAQPPNHSDQPGTFYAASSDPNMSNCDGRIFVTNNSGASWSQANHFQEGPAAGPNRTPMRIGLGVGRGMVVAAVSDCQGFLTSRGGQGKVIYTSTRGGFSWDSVSVPQDPTVVELGDWFSTGHSVGQGGYDNVVALDPADTDCCLAVFGGVSSSTIDFGGPNTRGFTALASPFEGPVHPDYHAAAFSADGNTLYVGTDGGVWSFQVQMNPNEPQPFPLPPNFHPPVNHMNVYSPTNLNTGIDAIQFYRGDATDRSHVVGGAQDNGVIGNLTGPWTSYTPNNDGGYVSLNGHHVFWETDSNLQTGTWDRSTRNSPNVNQTVCDPSGGCLAAGDPALFIDTPNALVTDLAGSSVLYATDRLLGKPLRDNGSLTQYSPTLSGTSPLGDCALLTLSPLLPPTTRDCFSAISAHVSTTTGGVALGSDLGQVWIHSGCFLPGASSPQCAQGEWVQHPPSTQPGSIPPPTGTSKIPNIPWITGTAIRFGDPNEVWVTVGTTSGPRIYHTTAALSATPTWVTLDGSSLPTGLVATGLALDPGNPAVLYLSTSNGVFECLHCAGPTAQGNWQPVGPGLPNVWVWSVTVTQDRSSIIAWTFGRGAWAIGRAPGGGGSP